MEWAISEKLLGRLDSWSVFEIFPHRVGLFLLSFFFILKWRLWNGIFKQ